MRSTTSKPSNAVAAVYTDPADEQRFIKAIGKLSAQTAEELIVTGSFAVEWQVRRLGGPSRGRRLNDIDIVVENGVRSLEPVLAREFLIHHFHPTRERGNVLMQLVDADHRLRIDIFSTRSPSIVERSLPTTIGGVNCRVLSAEDLAARLLAIVGIVRDGRTIDPKYWHSVIRLHEVIDHRAVEDLWPEYRWVGKEDFETDFEQVRAVISTTPDVLKPHEYETDFHTQHCEWCVQTPEFPLTEPATIYSLLGHV